MRFRLLAMAVGFSSLPRNTTLAFVGFPNSLLRPTRDIPEVSSAAQRSSTTAASHEDDYEYYDFATDARAGWSGSARWNARHPNPSLDSTNRTCRASRSHLLAVRRYVLCRVRTTRNGC